MGKLNIIEYCERLCQKFNHRFFFAYVYIIICQEIWVIFKGIIGFKYFYRAFFDSFCDI